MPEPHITILSAFLNLGEIKQLIKDAGTSLALSWVPHVAKRREIGSAVARAASDGRTSKERADTLTEEAVTYAAGFFQEQLACLMMQGICGLRALHRAPQLPETLPALAGLDAAVHSGRIGTDQLLSSVGSVEQLEQLVGHVSYPAVAELQKAAKALIDAGDRAEAAALLAPDGGGAFGLSDDDVLDECYDARKLSPPDLLDLLRRVNPHRAAGVTLRRAAAGVALSGGVARAELVELAPTGGVFGPPGSALMAECLGAGTLAAPDLLAVLHKVNPQRAAGVTLCRAAAGVVCPLVSCARSWSSWPPRAACGGVRSLLCWPSAWLLARSLRRSC
jgi:hypothetical protein